MNDTDPILSHFIQKRRAMKRARDPIRQLLDSLWRTGKPSLSWVVKWSDGGRREPLAAAWAACQTPLAMWQLSHRFPVPCDEVVYRAIHSCANRSRAQRCQRVRETVVNLPTLQELLREELRVR